MADWSELKRLAEEAQSTFGSFDPSEAEFDLMAAITPDVILALIAENEQLREDHDKQLRLAQSGIQNTEAVLAENAKLRAEVLATFGPYHAENPEERVTFASLKQCAYLQHVLWGNRDRLRIMIQLDHRGTLL